AYRMYSSTSPWLGIIERVGVRAGTTRMTAAGRRRRAKRRGERPALAKPGAGGTVTGESLPRHRRTESKRPRGHPEAAADRSGARQAGTAVRPPSTYVLSPETIHMIPLPKLSARFEPRLRPLLVTVSFVAPSSASSSHRWVIGPSASTSGSQRARKVISSRRGGSQARTSPSAATLPSG